MKYVLITLLLLVGLAGSAQQTTESNYRNWIRTNSTTKSKIALVIGNSKYQYTTQLTEPSNDANELANALNAQGYEVLKAFNLDRRTLVKAISDFAENFDDYEEGVIYYAGHGFQVNGINYLVPTDANPRSAWQVEGECINVRYLLDAINQPSIPKLILVDACRNNPFAKSWSSEGRNAEVGMRAVQALSNSIVIFSTAEQTVVRDNNPFAETFARHIQQGGCVEGDIIGRVAVDISKSNPNQLIRPTGFLFNNICFNLDKDSESNIMKTNHTTSVPIDESEFTETDIEVSSRCEGIIADSKIMGDVHFLSSLPTTLVVRGNYSYGISLYSDDKGITALVESAGGVEFNQDDEVIFMDVNQVRRSYRFIGVGEIGRQGGIPIQTNMLQLDLTALQWFSDNNITKIYLKDNNNNEMRVFTLTANRVNEFNSMANCFFNSLDTDRIVDKGNAGLLIPTKH